MKPKNADVSRIAGIALGLLVISSGWSKAGDREKSDKVAAQMRQAVTHMFGGAAPAGLEFKALPKPLIGTPGGVVATVNMWSPWNAEKAEKAFNKALKNSMDARKLLGSWNRVATIDSQNSYFAPPEQDVRLVFSSLVDPFGDDVQPNYVVTSINLPAVEKRSSPCIVHDASILFNKTQWGFKVECGLFNDLHLICKEVLEKEKAAPIVTWEGFERSSHQ